VYMEEALQTLPAKYRSIEMPMKESDR